MLTLSREIKPTVQCRVCVPESRLKHRITTLVPFALITTHDTAAIVSVGDLPVLQSLLGQGKILFVRVLLLNGLPVVVLLSKGFSMVSECYLRL